MKLDQTTRIRRLALLWLVGSTALAFVTLVCFRLGASSTTTAFAYLIVIVLLSLMDSLISSAIFSVIAVGFLGFFFVEPLFSFHVEYAQDIATLGAFLVTSFVVTGLVRRTRDLGNAQREQARLLDLTSDVVVVRDMNDVITYWNRGAEELYGWKRQEAVGKITHQLLQTIFPTPREEIGEALSRNGRWEGELTHTRRDGTQVVVASRWSLRQDEHGQPAGTLETNNDITERKRAQDALRRNQAAYLAEAQKLSRTGSFGWNTSSGEIFWSEESFRIFGYDPAPTATIEMVAQRVHPDDAALVQQVIDRATNEKQDFDFEHRLLMPDGSVKHLHVVAHGVADEPDKPLFVGAVMDVTARKRIEEELRYSEHRFQNLLLAMQASFWEMDATGVQDMLRALLKSGITDLRAHFNANPDLVREMMRRTRIVDINEQTVTVFGGNKETLLENIGAIWPEESTWYYGELVAQSVDGASSGTVECKFRRLDGSRFDGHLTAAFPPKGYRKGPLVVGIIDISERKAIEAALRHSEYRYRNLFGAMAASFWELDFSGVRGMLRDLRQSGVEDFRAYFDANPGFVREIMRASRVIDVNDQTVALFGRGSKEELLTNVEPFFPEESTRAFAESILQSISGKPNYSTECKFRRIDGATFDGLFTAAFPPETLGKGTLVVGVIDITERKQAERERRISEQRYQNVFQAMAVSFWQLDFTRTNEMLRDAHASGVSDFRRYFAENPDFMRAITLATHVVDVNERTLSMFGAGKKEDLLTTPLNFWAEGSFGDYMEMALLCIETRRPVSMETQLRKLDGTTFPVELTLMASPDDRNSGLVGVVDITERKKAGEALRRSEQRYRNLFRAMTVSFFELDFSGVRDLLQALRASGVTDLRQHFKQHPEVVRQFMRATRVLDVNDQTVALFGRGSREGLLDNVEPFWPEESTQAYAQAILSSLNRQPSFSIETPLRRLDGSMFDAHFTVWYSTEDSALGLGGVIDISERRKAFAELERSEQRYRYLFHYMPISLTQIDASGLVTLFKELRAQGVTDLKPYIDEHPDFLRRAMDALVVEEVNEHTVKMFGARDASEMLGPITRYWRESPDTIRRSIETRYRGQESFQEETKITTLDGRVIDVLFATARPAPASDKSLVGFIDITARQQAYAALEQSELRYRNLFHYMPIPLFQTDSTKLIALVKEIRAQGVTDLDAYIDAHPDFVRQAMNSVIISEVNRSAVELFGGRDESDLCGPVEQYWRESPDTYRHILVARYRGDPQFREQTRMATLDGRILEGVFTAAFPERLTELGISLNAFVDATDRIRAEEMLERVQAEFAHAARISVLGELTASIAHEVNQPLAAITTNAEVSLRRLDHAELDIEKVRELMKRMVADARRAADIISRVRTMAARREPEQARLSLYQVVDEVLLFLGHEIQSRGVTVALDRAPVPDVLADRTQLQQVFVNLAVNAIQAMAQSGSARRILAIRTTRAADGAACCIVEDSGPGIDPEHLDRLFASFFTTKDGGMGMGLPICRSIIEAHGGRIQADNESAHGGARFSFTLPAAA